MSVPKLYEMTAMAVCLALAGYMAWRWSNRFSDWSLRKPGLRGLTRLFLASAFLGAGMAQQLYDEQRPIRVLVGVITEVDQDQGKFGNPKDSGSFSVVGDMNEAVTLSTPRWMDLLVQGQRVRVFYQEKTSLHGNRVFGRLNHADLLSSNDTAMCSLNNAEDLDWVVSPWFLAAGIMTFIALPLPRRDGSTGGINENEFNKATP